MAFPVDEQLSVAFKKLSVKKNENEIKIEIKNEIKN